MATKIDRELQSLLSNDKINTMLDGLEEPDDSENVNKPPQELIPTIFNDEQTRVDNIDDYDKIYKLNVENLGGLISRNNAALEATLKMAIELESPKLLETAALFINTGKETTLALAKLAAERQKSSNTATNSPKTEQPNAIHNTQNNYYGYAISEQEEDALNATLDGIEDNDNKKTTTRKPRKKATKKV